MIKAYEKFIILSMPRSGSNYLSYLLHDHPQIISFGEVYDKSVIWSQPEKIWLQGKPILKKIRDYFPMVFLKLFIFSRYPRSISAVGLRFFYQQVEYFPSVFNYLLRQNDLKIIHLKRRNILDNLVSLKIALKTDIWISLKQKKEPNVKIRLSYQVCLNYFINTEKLWKKYDKEFRDFSKIDVYYEDLCQNPQKELERVLSLLGVPYRRLFCPLRKQNIRSLRNVIINYDELKEKFVHSKWGHFFI